MRLKKGRLIRVQDSAEEHGDCLAMFTKRYYFLVKLGVSRAVTPQCNNPPTGFFLCEDATNRPFVCDKT